LLIPKYREIYMACGTPFVVSHDDYARVSALKWHADRRVYADGDHDITYVRRVDIVEGKRRKVYLHRFITKAPDWLFVDHQDRDGLNNTRENMQVVSPFENSTKKWLYKIGATGFRGVRRLPNGRYQARIRRGEDYASLGTFETAEAAALEYDISVIREQGAFVQLNFPERWEYLTKTSEPKQLEDVPF